MTGASLFNWDYDRKTVQGGADLFGDSYGKTTVYNNNNQSTDDQNTDNNSSNTNAITNSNTNEISETDPHYTCFKDYLSTYVFPNNNWRTVLRINERSPSFVTNDYVDAMFSGVFGNWPKKLPAPSTTPQNPPQSHEKKKSDCVLL